MEPKLRVINAKKTGSLSHTVSEIWQCRELLYFLVWKEIKIRYKQTAIGAVWAILQPLFTMVIFWFVFGAILDVQTSVPYPIFAYTGLVLWTYFSTALNASSNAIMGNASLLTKVYFPRILLPLSLCLVNLLDYAIATAMLFVLMFVFNIMPTVWMLLIFVPLVLSILLVSGLGIWLSAVSAKYHDIKYIIPFFVQLLLFVTPIIYPPSSIPSYLSWVIDINPLSGIIEAQRAFILGTQITNWAPLAYSALVSVALFFFGIMYFSRYERQIADVI